MPALPFKTKALALGSKSSAQDTPTRSGCLPASIRGLFAVHSWEWEQSQKGKKQPRDRRSSTPPCWDMHSPAHLKTLPTLPPANPTPPLPIAERRYRSDTRQPPRKTPVRGLSWSEDQINKLQQDNRDLRKKIIAQERIDVGKDQTIAALRQQNAQYKQELNQKNDVTQFANSIVVAVQDFQKAQSRQSSDYGDTPKGNGRETSIIGDALSDIIRVYSQI